MSVELKPEPDRSGGNRIREGLYPIGRVEKIEERA